MNDRRGADVAHDGVNPNPVVTYYPQCAECKVPCLLRMCMRFGGALTYEWMWQRDCKHKKAALEVVSPDGTVAPNDGGAR